MSARAANEFAFVNARIRGLKAQLLTVGDYERLMQAKDYDEFLKVLMATPYGPVVSRADPSHTPYPETLALILAQHFSETVDSLTRTLTGRVRGLTESYLRLLLAESIKSIVRGVHVGLEQEEILRFAVPASPEEEQVFRGLAEAGSVDRLIDLLPYTDLRVALLTRLPAFEQYDSTAPLEVALEEWGLRSIEEALERFSATARKPIISLMERRVVLRNLLTVLRAMRMQLGEDIVRLSLIRFTSSSDSVSRSMLGRANWREVFARLEQTRYREIASRLARTYGDGENLADVELAIEDHLAQRTRLLLMAFPFHPGTVFGFFGLKYYEIRNIRSIAVGVERGESPATIRQMITMV